ncbi:MAG: chemotaxis protein CheD [Sedimentisphaerales bacterium]|nr:chemotaxis protein CheD [Sedimentisphaerales bacterium]
MAKEKIYSLSALKNKQVKVVKISDMKVSDDPSTTLVTYALGSCIAVTLYDPVKHVGGLLHYLLPSAREIDTGKEQNAPMKYADTGFPLLLKAVCKMGAVKRRLITKVAGGAQVLKASKKTDIGRYNYEMLSELLHEKRLSIRGKDVGGTYSRTVMLEIDSGRVTIRGGGKIIYI